MATGFGTNLGWDVHPDGRRFVFIRTEPVESVASEERPERYWVVVDWFEELRSLTGGGG